MLAGDEARARDSLPQIAEPYRAQAGPPSGEGGPALLSPVDGAPGKARLDLLERPDRHRRRDRERLLEVGDDVVDVLYPDR